MPLAPFGTENVASESESSSYRSSYSKQESGAKYTPEQEKYLAWLRPELKSRLGETQPGQDFSNYLSSVGGTPVDVPEIPMVQAYSQDQINAKINSYFSGADVRTGTDQRLAANQVAGRGFSTNSPLLMELQQSAAGRNYRTAMESAREFDIDAAVANADLESQIWNLRLQAAGLESYDDIRRREAALKALGYDVQRENYLLQAMGANLAPLPYSSSENYSVGGSQSSSYSTHSPTPLPPGYGYV